MIIKSNTILQNAINNSLKNILSYSKVNKINSDYNIDKEGKFRIFLNKHDKKVRLYHNGSYDIANTIDLLFKYKGQWYLIIFSDCEIDLFPEHLETCKRMIKHFFDGNVKVVKEKTILFFKQDYLHLGDERPCALKINNKAVKE